MLNFKLHVIDVVYNKDDCFTNSMKIFGVNFVYLFIPKTKKNGNFDEDDSRLT